jgi:TolB protein
MKTLHKAVSKYSGLLLLLATLAAAWLAAAPQEQRQAAIRIGIPLSLELKKLAVADFRGSPDVVPLVNVFNQVVWNDLENSGVVELVSKSFYPQNLPERPGDLAVPGALTAWSGPPTNAQLLAFGNASKVGGNLVVQGFLYDTTGSARPEILARQYTDVPSEAAARVIAHRFADAIIGLIGGGPPGIAESKIYFVRQAGPGKKEIWVMDYDGANQHAVTQYGSLSLTPAVSPDGSRLGFTSYFKGNPQVFILSLASMRQLSFINPHGALNTTPAWSPDGAKIAFSSSLTGDPEIYVANEDGRNLRRLTNSPGVDISPQWNPKTGSTIAFVSGRGGIPQVYLMDSDGSNVRRLSGGEGDAVQPCWLPNGQTIAFSWTRGFAPGNYNVFLIDVAGGQLVQLTHGAGRNEHPWFSPDGRQVVFESDRRGGKQIYTMLADGTKIRALTTSGSNSSPVWSAK